MIKANLIDKKLTFNTLPFIVLITCLILFVSSSLQAQFVSLDFNEPSYEVIAKPIGTTGVTYSMTTIVNNGATATPAGFADGTLEMDGACADCGRTVRITFSTPIELLISGKLSGNSWFGSPGDGFWNVSSPDGTFTLADPLSELQDLVVLPSDITFNGVNGCEGALVSPCQDWSIASPVISTIDVQFQSNPTGPNGSAIRFQINETLPIIVPTLSQWGIIILTLLLLNLSIMWMMKRKVAVA